MFPIKTILFPTDYSEGSEHALSLACDLAVAHGAHLVALHVVEPPLFAPMPPAHDIRDRLEQWMRWHRGRGTMPSLECRDSEGVAWEQIPRVAEDCQCDLIVMGSVGKSGLGRAVLGSVAESVARQATCPVLICKPIEGKPKEAGQPLFSTILFPADLSDRAREAFSVATALAGPGSRLIVQHVVAATDEAPPQPRSTVLERLHEMYPEDGVTPVVYRLTGGDPAEEIRRAVEDTHCDLIVMSSHGREGLDRLRMGSVAESIFRMVKVPVVIVHSTRPVPAFKADGAKPAFI